MLIIFLKKKINFVLYKEKYVIYINTKEKSTDIKITTRTYD